MIWHFFEVWLLVAASFSLGTLIGAVSYVSISRSGLARAQGLLADRVGDVLDAIGARFGAERAWRPKVRRAPVRPSIQARAAAGAFAAPPADARIEPRRPAWLLDDGKGGPEAESRWSVATEEAVLIDLPDGQLAAAAEAVFNDADNRPGITPMRPVGLAAPRNGVPDDLQRIRGIGQRNEELLNSLGIFHFGQIASWTPGEARWIGAYLAFPDRIERDDWVGQATVLATGGDTGYVKAERKKREEGEVAE
jgi:predicted flap endonuclease-1-like 5' DNA nuclease